MGSSSKSPCGLQLASFIAILVLFVSTEARPDQSVFTLIQQGYSLHMGNTIAWKVHTESRTWAEAKEVCIEEGAHLAIIDSYEKVGIIGRMKSSNAYVWVGVSRLDQQHPWIKITDGATMTNIPWAPTKPSGPYNCLTVRGCNRGLSNEDCNVRRKFVCEKLPGQIQT